MKYLLDTHTLLWAILTPEKLSPTAYAILKDPTNIVLVSAVSIWEVSLKSSLGKLTMEGLLPDDLPKICHDIGFELLPLEADVCASYHQIGVFYHKDPFDRMLIWLAKNLKTPILSADPTIKQYESIGVKVVW